MLTIGVTGGIGSGKSTVAAMLRELGAAIINADQVGHRIYEQGTLCYREVVAAFTKDILAADGSIDRRKLGAIVFSDPAALGRLNSIVHARMFEQMRQTALEMRRRGEPAPIVIDAAVLIEANWQTLCDEIWVVVTSRERVIARIQRDRAMAPEQTEARIRAQLSDEERRKHATLVIDNNGTIEELRAKVAELWRGALVRGAKT